jgi:hypothetical protein
MIEQTLRLADIRACFSSYLELATEHRRIPLAAPAISSVVLVAILIFVEKKKPVLPKSKEDGAVAGSKMAPFVFCASLVVHGVVLSFL